MFLGHARGFGWWLVTAMVGGFGGCGMGGCGGFFFFFFSAVVCGCGGFDWWLVVAMVGGYGGCGMGEWMWWPTVLG